MYVSPFPVKDRCYVFSITGAEYKSFHHKDEELNSYSQVALPDRFLKSCYPSECQAFLYFKKFRRIKLTRKEIGIRGTNQTFEQIYFPCCSVSFHLFLCFFLSLCSKLLKAFLWCLGGIGVGLFWFWFFFPAK